MTTASPQRRPGRHADAGRHVDAGEPGEVVVRGAASAEEIAAVTAVLSRLMLGAEPEPDTATRPAQSRSTWTRHSDLLRRDILPGPGAWRASAWRV